MQITLVEPYYGGSHRAWADGYAANSAHEVTLVTHDAQFWKWRMHGAHLTLAQAIAGRPDVVLASSMMNVAAFLGSARDTLDGARVAVYFHESQFTYPLSPLDRPDDTYPMINWSSAAVADLVIFNSEYHRQTFFEQVERLLRQFPDRPHTDRIAEVEKRSTVLPVGIDVGRFGPRGEPGGIPLLVWNQRWEHDKGPDELVDLLADLIATGADFLAAVVGERFVSAPEAFDRLPGLLGDRLVEFGYVPDDAYADLLSRADVVLSTAHQEFFGVGVVEGIAAGAFPVLPNRLVYPEHIPSAYRERCLYDGDGAAKVRWAFDHRGEAAAIAANLSSQMAEFDWSLVAPRYDAALETL